jgi:hypothetical protein
MDSLFAAEGARRRDLPPVIRRLDYRTVERHGPPEALVTDSGSVFRANRASAVYESLGFH